MDSTNNAKGLLKNTAIFAIGTFGSKVLSLLITPLLTHYIGTTDMGIYDMVYTVVTLLQPIAMLAVAESLFRWLLEWKANKDQIISTWFTMFASFLGFFSIVFWTAFLFFHFSDAMLIYILVILGCAYQSAQYGCRGLHRNKLFAVQGVLYTIVYCVMSWILVVVLHFGHAGLLWAMLVGYLSSTAAIMTACPELRHIARGGFNLALARAMAKYSVFLLPNSLSWWALTWLGRVFIVGFLGYAANGVFSIAMKFPSALSMISSIFAPAWQEQAVSLYGQEGSERYFSDVFRQYARFFFSLLLPLLPFTAFFIELAIDASYGESVNLIPVLYLGALFSALSSFFGVLYLCAKDTRGAASTTVLGALANSLGSLALIPISGIYGAALANMFGNLVVWLARVRQTKKYCTISINWYEIGLLTVAIIIMSQLVRLAPSMWLELVLAVVGAAVAFVFCRKEILAMFRVFKKKVA